MEYIEGETLAELQDNGNVLSVLFNGGVNPRKEEQEERRANGKSKNEQREELPYFNTSNLSGHVRPPDSTQCLHAARDDL